MKKYLSLPRAAFLALVLGTASTTASFAQSSTGTGDSDSTPPANTGCHRHHSVLTADEKAQLKKDHAAALAAHPDLQTQEANLKQQHQDLGANPTEDQKKALFQQWKEFKTQLRAAELQIDPTAAPIFTKLDAARQHGHHHKPDQASDTSATSS